MFSCAVLNNDLAINTTKTLNERKKADIIMDELIVFCVGGCNTDVSVTKYVAQ